MWGKHKENGVWVASSNNWKFLFDGHDALYIAAGRLRLRIMKPGREEDDGRRGA